MSVVSFLEHRTREGERWDLLAWDYYGDPLRFEPIIAANPTAPITPMLPSGLRLLIPVFAAEDLPVTATLPPWKR